MFRVPNPRLLGVALTGVLLSATAGSAGATLLALEFTSGAGTTPGELLSVDAGSGLGTTIGTTGAVAGMGLADLGNRLFSFDQNSDRLIEIDPTSGATLASIDIGSGGAISGEGALSFRSDGVGFITYSTNQLASFDLTSGVLNVIGDLGVQIDGMDFASDGTLFGISQSSLELYMIDTVAPGVTLVGDTGLDDTDGTAVAGLTFAPDGTLYAALNESLYTLSTATGAATLVGGPILARGSISGLTSIELPEPSTLSLLALGVVALRGRRARQQGKHA